MAASSGELTRMSGWYCESSEDDLLAGVVVRVLRDAQKGEGREQTRKLAPTQACKVRMMARTNTASRPDMSGVNLVCC